MDTFSSKIPFLYRRVAAKHFRIVGALGLDERRNSANVPSVYWRLLGPGNFRQQGWFSSDTLARVDWWKLEIDDPVQAYLRAVATVRSLTNDEETELSRHVVANDEEPKSAGKTLVEANLAMVVSIAERYPRGNRYLYGPRSKRAIPPSCSRSKRFQTTRI